jgi:hypothetical protein
MKILPFILLFVLVGCSRHEAQQPKVESAKLGMVIQNDIARQEGWTNNCLVYWVKDKPVATDVYSLQRGIEILGQYGWKFVSSESDGTHEYYHIQREVQVDKSDGYDPIIMGMSGAQFNKP